MQARSEKGACHYLSAVLSQALILWVLRLLCLVGSFDLGTNVSFPLACATQDLFSPFVTS